MAVFINGCRIRTQHRAGFFNPHTTVDKSPAHDLLTVHMTCQYSIWLMWSTGWMNCCGPAQATSYLELALRGHHMYVASSPS